MKAITKVPGPRTGVATCSIPASSSMSRRPIGAVVDDRLTCWRLPCCADFRAVRQAHAGLFDDDEARRQIKDCRSRPTNGSTRLPRDRSNWPIRFRRCAKRTRVCGERSRSSAMSSTQRRSDNRISTSISTVACASSNRRPRRALRRSRSTRANQPPKHRKRRPAIRQPKHANTRRRSIFSAPTSSRKRQRLSRPLPGPIRTAR
jgi:hypothetical protein